MDIVGGTQETPETGFMLYKIVAKWHHGQVAVNISDYLNRVT